MHREGRSQAAPSDPDQQGQPVLPDVIPRAGAHAVDGGDVEHLERGKVHPVELPQGAQPPADHLPEGHHEDRELRLLDSLRV